MIGAEGTDGQILDDQWLGTLLETGIPGAVGWLWLMVLCIRRFATCARPKSSEAGLLTALAAAVAAFAAGMLFYDTFAFIQVSLLFFVLIALGSVARPPPSRYAGFESRLNGRRRDSVRSARGLRAAAERLADANRQVPNRLLAPEERAPPDPGSAAPPHGAAR